MDRSTHPSNTKGGRSTLDKVLIAVMVVFVAQLIAGMLLLGLELSREPYSYMDGFGHNETDGRAMSRASSLWRYRSQLGIKKERIRGPRICTSFDCIEIAAKIHSYIDFIVFPCDNLYKFACGRWVDKTSLPKNKAIFTQLDYASEQNVLRLKSVLAQAPKSSDSTYVQKAKNLYASCMNHDLINLRGDKSLKDLLIKEFGGWPLTHAEWSESAFKLEDLMVKLNKHGMESIFSINVGVDQNKLMLQVETPKFGVSDAKFYLRNREDRMLKAYENLIYQVGRIMGFASDPDLARVEVAKIVDFEKSLASAYAGGENSVTESMELSKFYASYSKHFNWREYLGKMMSLPEIGIRDLTDGEFITVHSPNFYLKIDKLASKRELANYLLWRFVYSVMGTQGENYLTLGYIFDKMLTNRTSRVSRFVKCTKYTEENLDLAVGRMFVDQYFDAQTKAAAMEMVTYIKDAFKELVNDLDWMDSETKKAVQEKNKLMTIGLGYPDEVLNGTYLEEYYAKVSFEKDDFFENVLKIRAEKFYNNRRSLRKPVDKNKILFSAATVKPFYHPLHNAIIVPAGLLQPPFYSKAYPNSLNFGGIGTILGHEFLHAFESTGQRYNKSGSFNEGAECMEKQYGNYFVPEAKMKIDGKRTQAENIIDNGGMNQAYRAYRKWVAKKGKEEQLLPALPYSHDKLFFVGFAQQSCEIWTKPYALKSVQTDRHSLSQFRVIGPAQNSRDFAKAFRCSPESYMNPPKKCKIW